MDGHLNVRFDKIILYM